MKIDLLTVEEVKKLPVEILKCDVPKKFDGYVSNNKCWWWLRSSGYNSNHAEVVDASGAVIEDGCLVVDDDFAIRPIIRFNKKEDINRLSKTKKGYIKFLGTKWIDISKYLNKPCLLKKECLEKSHKFDKKSNDYETSKIKVYIEKWFKEKQQSNWILDLKETDHDVLCCNKYGDIMIGLLVYSNYFGRWMCASNELLMEDVIAWMSLPLPYKAERKEREKDVLCESINV